MTPTWADKTQAIAAVIACFIAIIGFIFLYWQISQVERAISGDTNASLFEQNFEMMKLFVEKPCVRPYFYDGKPLAKGDSNKDLVLAAAGIMASFFEHVALQKGNLSKDAWDGWVMHIKDMCKTSPALVNYYKEHTKWYSNKILSLICDCEKSPASGQPNTGTSKP